MTPTSTNRDEALLIEQHAEQNEIAAALANRINDMTDGFAPTEEHPEGKRMPDDDFDLYQTLAQQHQIACGKVQRTAAALKNLRAGQTLASAAGLSARAAFRAYAMNGDDGARPLTDEEKEAFITTIPDSNRYAGMSAFRIQSALTRSGAGNDESAATAVDQEIVQGVLVENMQKYGGVANIASVMTTMHGRNVAAPNVDATAQEGVRLSENTPSDDLDAPPLGDTVLRDWIYASGVVPLSNQLIRDASFDIVVWAEGALVTRNARIIEKEMTVGTGNNRPDGFTDKMKVGVTAANQQSITWGEYLELYGEVDDDYLTGMPGHGLGTGGAIAYVMNKKTYVALMQLADSENRPLYLPTINATGGMMLFGYPVVKVYGMPDIAAGASPVGFGNFGYYICRIIGDTLALRFTDSVYAKRGTTGFLAFNEADGRWVQKTDANGKITCAQMLQMAS